MAAKKKTKTTKKKAAAPKRSAPKRSAAKKPAKKAAARSAPKAKAQHQIIHWEIQSQNPALLHRFYADAFGWIIDASNPMNYGMVSSGGPAGIDGGIGGSQAPGSRVVVYAAVPSIPTALERIESHGGRTLMPRTDLGMVIMALYQDPEGNTMGLVEG
jgi:predicted enzyme related to lactoylglutathione lyase